jgi:adenylate cyclase
MSDWTCAGCGGTNPAGTRFCGHCGRPPAAEPSPSDGWSCRDCGGANLATARFCGQCGGQRRETREDEVRLVTALFCDISGFTTLADRLDTEELHDVVRPLVAGLARIAERYDGFIEKYAGDALLVVFGAPTTHEDDPQRALLAALDMHAALAQLLAELGPDADGLTLHIGVNTGRVIAGRTGSATQGDYAVLGDSVILAQRLESAAPPGETYVGPTTRELTRADFTFESVGALQLKGKLEPVEAFRLTGRRTASASTASPLVARQQELAVLDRVLDAARAARGSTVAVVGEPGTGKSRLVAEAHRHADDRGMRWLAARCLSYGASLPYWPFADLLRQTLGVAPDDPPAQVRQHLAVSVSPDTLPGVQRLLGLSDDDVDPQRARREAHDGFVRWLHDVAAVVPVVLCVEDVHWVDRASADLLGEVVRSVRDAPVAIVLTARGDGRDVVEPLVADVDGTTIEVGPLHAAAVPALAGALLGGAVAPPLVELLTRKAGGNPLFVEELASALHESGALLLTSAGWDVKPGWDSSTVPETVERVFAARLDVLPVPAAGLLQVASVIGRTTRRPLLAAVAEAEGASLAPLESLVQARLLDEVVDAGEPAVTFHHALLQDVVYGRLLRKRRRALHRRVADVARALHGDGDDTIDLLARHLYLGDAGEDAFHALLRAGRRAARLYANDEAALHLERAVEVLRGLPDRAADLPDVVLELADVQDLRGEYDDALRLYEQVRSSADDVRAWRGVTAVLRKRGQYTAALSVLDDFVGDDPGLLLERGRTMCLLGRLDEAEVALRQGLEGATRLSRTAGLLLLQLAATLEYTGRLDEAASSAAAAIELFQQRSDDRHEAIARRYAGGIARLDGRLEDAARDLEHAEQLACRMGMVEEAAGTLLNLGLLRADLGHVAAAVRDTQEAVAVFERLGHGSGRAVGYGNLADFYTRLGQWTESEQWCHRALDHAARIGHAPTLSDVMTTLARVKVGQGRWFEASAAADVAATRLDALGVTEQAAEMRALADDARGRAELSSD